MTLKLRVVPHARTTVAADRAWPHARRSRPTPLAATSSTQAVERNGAREELRGAQAHRVRTALGEQRRVGGAWHGATPARPFGAASRAGVPSGASALSSTRSPALSSTRFTALSSTRLKGDGIDRPGGGSLAVARPTLDERLERFESFVSDRASACVWASKRAAARTVDACSRFAAIDDPALREVSSFLFFVAMFAAAFLI